MCAVRKCLSFLVMIILPVWEEGRSPTECCVKLRVRGRRIFREGWEVYICKCIQDGKHLYKSLPVNLGITFWGEWGEWGCIAYPIPGWFGACLLMVIFTTFRGSKHLTERLMGKSAHSGRNQLDHSDNSDLP